MIYLCCDELRRDLVKAHASLNGIDFLEVSDNSADPVAKRQRTLFVHFVKNFPVSELQADNIRIEGGERVRNIKVARVESLVSSPPTSPPAANVLAVEVTEPGDFSVYRLRLVQDDEHLDPPQGFDPLLSQVDFSFKVACPSDFDCKPRLSCAAEARVQPEINYLARDYASFRQLLLDRMAITLPQWHGRNPAGLGIALVELLAYAGDYLSYQQDAVATEAYLGTARRRVSVRRHARLVDYHVHDGSNSRALVQIRVAADNVKIPTGAQILTRLPKAETRIAPNSTAYDEAIRARPLVFETMTETLLFQAHNEIEFHTWGDERCCLPRGATRATLNNKGERLKNLKVGDVLILVEVRNPQNANAEEADHSHRHPVRLIEIAQAVDPLFSEDGIGALRVLEVRWAEEDALPFPLCLWRVGETKEPASIALGNIVVADHGSTIAGEFLGEVPAPRSFLAKVAPQTRDFCQESEARPTAARFRPRLKHMALTHAGTWDPGAPPASAQAMLKWPGGELLPAVSLTSELNGEISFWKARRDLLQSGPQAREFAVEIESDGAAFIRFGDDRFGLRPAAGTRFTATYRVGNGIEGNVGAETLSHIVSTEAAITKVRNPLPAQGGAEPESIEQARERAPYAFRTQKRAVSPADYAEVAHRCAPDVQRAAATFRWTGSWRTVFLTVDRLGGGEVNAQFEQDLRSCLERYRMTGHDLEIDGPTYVALAIEMIVCVKPDYSSAEVKAALLEVFSNRILPDGRRGVFHPDNFTFGQSVFLSPLYAAAQTIAGVDSVVISTFERQGIASTKALDEGRLELDRLEIARLDNDPNFPERGALNLIVKGGR